MSNLQFAEKIEKPRHIFAKNYTDSQYTTEPRLLNIYQKFLYLVYCYSYLPSFYEAIISFSNYIVNNGK